MACRKTGGGDAPGNPWHWTGRVIGTRISCLLSVIMGGLHAGWHGQHGTGFPGQWSMSPSLPKLKESFARSCGAEEQHSETLRPAIKMPTMRVHLCPRANNWKSPHCCFEGGEGVQKTDTSHSVSNGHSVTIIGTFFQFFQH